MADREVSLKLNIKGQPDEARRALSAVNDALKQQQQSLLVIDAQTRKAADVYKSDLATQEKRRALQEEMRRQAEAQGMLAEKAVSAEDRRLAALRSINQEMASQQQRLARLKEASSPEQLARKAATDQQVEGAEKDYRKKLRAAKGKGGALADLGDELSEAGLPGGQLLGKLQGGLNKMAPGLSGGINKALGGLMGGGSAAAVLGPIGAAVGAAAMLAPVVKGIASAPFKAVEAGFGGLNKALAGLSGTLGPIGSLLGAVEGYGSGIKAAGDALGPFGIGLQVMGGTIEGLTRQLNVFLQTAVHLGSAASPGQATRFQRALKDTEATVGQRFVPILEKMTDAVRLAGDVLMTILPSWQEMKTALSPLGDALKDIRAAITPVAYLLKSELSFALKVGAVMLRDMASALRYFLGPLIGMKGGLELQSSVGAAPMAASTSGIDEYAKKVYTGALSGQGEDPNKKTAANTTSMLQVLLDLPQKLADRLAAALGSIRDSILGGLQGIGGGILNSNALKGILGGGAIGGLGNIKLPSLAGFKLPELKLPSFAAIGDELRKAFDSIPPFFRGDFTGIKDGLKQALEEAIPAPLRALFKGSEGGGQGVVEQATEGAKGLSERLLEQIRDAIKSQPQGEGEAPQEEESLAKQAMRGIIPRWGW